MLVRRIAYIAGPTMAFMGFAKIVQQALASALPGMDESLDAFEFSLQYPVMK